MINRRQSLSALFVALTAGLTCVHAGTEKDPSVADLAGTWNVENPTDRHVLKGAKAIQLHPDGTASIVHSNMTFQRRWKLVNEQLTISDPPGQVPGPPVRFAIAEVDATRTRMRLKGDFPSAAKDVQLVRSK